MRKTLYTLNVNDYAPSLTRYTRPLIDGYATKIGAERVEITERRWPTYAPVYEKLQIFDLARERDDEWSYYLDLDALVHPDLWDPADLCKMDTVGHHGADLAGNRWKIDDVFRRDGRLIGSCNWFTWASRWCRDLWAQPEIAYQECLARIKPIHLEACRTITPDHLVDDYILSRNIARFGLKFTTILKLMKDMDDQSDYTDHQYLIPMAEKAHNMRRVLGNWVICDYRDPKIPGWMSPSELAWLYLTAQEYETIVEVGCWRGKSTHALLSGCKGKVVAVDTFAGAPDERQTNHYAATKEDIRKDMLHNVASARGNLEVIVGNSPEVAERFADGSVDMVFIDGAHDREGVARDIRAWWPKCKRLLCGHDFFPNTENGISAALRDTMISPRLESGSIWSTSPRREFGG